MKRWLLAAGVLFGGAAATLARPERPALDVVEGRYLDGIEHARSLVALARDAAGTAAPDSLRSLFRGARGAWKRVEYLAEFYNPGTSKAINGAPLPWVAEDDPNRFVIPPEGFQRVEELLFADVVAREEAGEELAILHASLTRLQASARATALTPSNVFEAIRLELLRVVSLGASGYDSPVAGESGAEVAEVFRELARVSEAMGGSRAGDLVLRLERCAAQSPGAVGGDLLTLVVDGVIPAARELSRLQEALGVPRPLDSRSWAARADYPTDSGALDPLDFALPESTPATPARIRLGLGLLGDPRLSGDGLRACTSCHQPERAWTDGARVPRALDSGHLPRNTPTLLNSALQNGSFYDLRTSFLEDQARDVIENRREMHGSMAEVARRLSDDPVRRREFALAFGASPDSAIPEAQVRLAIADAVRSLVAVNSGFDRYLRGDRGAMDDSARAGFNVFMGKAKCGTCHFFPLFNGSVPPLYRSMESEVLGVPAHATRPWRPSPDSGRARLIPSPVYLGAIKTTTVRNAALTGPWMHNGVFATMEEVIDFYNGGGGRGHGLEVPNQTLPADSLHLTAGERRQLIRFIESLNDQGR